MQADKRITSVRPTGMKPTREKWNRDPNSYATLKNQWDFRAFELHDSAKRPMLHMHTYDPKFNLGLGYSDNNEHSLVAGKVEYFDGTSRRALYEFATMKTFLLPDPPNPTFDRAHLYTTPQGQKIPRDLWEIMFYTLKPFVDEEVCNHVKSKKIVINVLFEELELIYGCILHVYTGKWSPRRLSNDEESQWTDVMTDTLISMIQIIVNRHGNFTKLKESDWRHIMMTFGDSFMRLFGHDMVDQCYNCKISCAAMGSRMFRCGFCKDTIYCGKTCQKEDWKKGHKFQCSSKKTKP